MFLTLILRRLFLRQLQDYRKLVTDETKGVYYTEGHVRTCCTRALVVSISSLYASSLFYLHRPLVIDCSTKQDDPLIVSYSSIGTNLEALYKRGLPSHSSQFSSVVNSVLTCNDPFMLTSPEPIIITTSDTATYYKLTLYLQLF